jgi:hypothetical protein
MERRKLVNEAVRTALAVEQAMYVDAPRERVFELLTDVNEAQGGAHQPVAISAGA